MKDITNLDYSHRKKIWRDFEIKNLGEYHELYPEKDTLLVNVFESIRKMLLELDLVKSLLGTEIILTSSFRKDQSKVRVINDWKRN